ncbi:cathepsin L1 [Nasonia vitripennis]|uniref:Uncharacterized protein n=1 Tax=Nasonia vitripennis TaxID=7425 RepID=A0A7M7HC77_NASVI|nr:cathepsin L1 [Nasonia vitripennis]
MKPVAGLFLFTFVIAANSISMYQTLGEEWKTFKLTYNKNYSTTLEDKVRFAIFLDNRHKIAKHNRDFEMGLVSFSLALNQFGDMTLHEFASKMNGFNRTARVDQAMYNAEEKSDEGASYVEPANVELPDEVDWRKQGAVTPVKNQGNCGSCWAFSATGSLEGQHFRHNGSLISLSEQNLVDCSGRFGNDGCDGGLMNNAFTYVKVNRGLDSEKSYPYEAEDDRCRYNPKNSAADDAGYVNIPTGSESKLQAAVATVGPISVAIDADSDSFMFYHSGVYYEPDCSRTDLDHGVLAIGYGTDSKTGKQFWLVKNSWGEDWGEKGYIRMSRNRHNNCGIATAASYPLVK